MLSTALSQQETTQSAVLHRTIIAHIGPMHNHHTFSWASRQAVQAHQGKTMVLSLCADHFSHLHLEAIALADEVQVLNLAGHLDARTLHELCYAYNLDKPISWLEEWPMYCPQCGAVGPESEHFFHNALSLRDLNTLLASCTAEHLPYLPGLLVRWYHQIVPMVLLPNGLPAITVDLACLHCDRFVRTAYAVGGEYGSWTTLLETDGRFLLNLCNADERAHTLTCQECREQQRQIAVAMKAEVDDGK